MKTKVNKSEVNSSQVDKPKQTRKRMTREEFIRLSLLNPKNLQTPEERIERLRKSALPYNSIKEWETALPYAVKTATEISCLDVCTAHMKGNQGEV
jgi:hypothetical protein